MRKFAFSYPLLLLVLWTGLLVTGDYVVLETSVQQIQAGGFATTVGEIMRSQLGQGAMSRRGIVIGYSYEVNGMDYTGHRYRYDDRNDAFDYKAVTHSFPPGSKQVVYYDPDNPAEAVLSPGLAGCDLLLALFALPLNVVTIGLWLGLMRGRRERSRLAPAGGIPTFQRPGETRVRLTEFTPAAAGFFALAAAAFVIGIFVVFASGFAPSLHLMSIVWIITALAGVTAFLWVAQRSFLGCYDLCIHGASQTVLLPAMGGRKEPMIVPLGEIVAVSMHRRVSSNPSGQHISYVPAVDRALHDAQPCSLELVNWGWPEAKARAFADWLSQQLGVRFKGVEEETESDTKTVLRR